MVTGTPGLIRAASQRIGRVGQAHAAVGDGRPGGAAEVLHPVDADLPGAAAELLQHVGAGARGEGIGRPGAARAA